MRIVVLLLALAGCCQTPLAVLDPPACGETTVD